MHIIRSPKAVAVESTRIADLQNQLADAKQQLKVEMETRAKYASSLCERLSTACSYFHRQGSS